MTDFRRVNRKARAKINLTLSVTGKRADGYHELETIMQTVSLCDDVTVEARTLKGSTSIGGDSRSGEGADIQLVISGDDMELDTAIPTDRRNTAYRACEEYLKRAGLAASVLIKIVKRIPVSAGLAGGSADAAAVLAALNAMYGALSVGELSAAAMCIGADVPFCLRGGACVATGVGDVLRTIKSPIDSLYIVLVNPRFPVLTEWVYKNYTLPGESEIRRFSAITRELSPPLCFNALESVTCERYPIIGEIKDRLVSYGALCAIMSGSGPTVFGLFGDESHAQKAVCAERSHKLWANACTPVIRM